MKFSQEVKEILKPWYPGLDLDKVKIVQGGAIAWFFAKFFDTAALAIGHTIYLTKKSYWRPEDPENIQGLSLLIHELWHIKQQEEMGVACFLLRYILEWVFSGFRYDIWLPLELPAHKIQREFLEAQKGA